MSVRASSAVPSSPRSARAPDSPSARRRSSSPLSKEERLNGRVGIEDVKQADAVRIPISSSKPPSSPPSAPAAPSKEASAPEAAASKGEQTAVHTMIDEETFNQIVELDEDDTHDFSYGMVKAYFTQARSTFDEMEQAFAAKNLSKLSDLGHFLKGSSAALGITRVQKSCERMQHYGKKWDEEAGEALTDEGAINKIEPLLGKVKGEYGEAEKWLKGWYVERGVKDED